MIKLIFELLNDSIVDFVLELTLFCLSSAVGPNQPPEVIETPTAWLGTPSDSNIMNFWVVLFELNIAFAF